MRCAATTAFQVQGQRANNKILGSSNGCRRSLAPASPSGPLTSIKEEGEGRFLSLTRAHAAGFAKAVQRSEGRSCRARYESASFRQSFVFDISGALCVSLHNRKSSAKHLCMQRLDSRRMTRMYTHISSRRHSSVRFPDWRSPHY